MPKIDTFEHHGQNFTRGDPIMVRPSAPRHRDGFLARVMSGIVDDTGVLTAIEVFGAPGSKAPGVRTLRLERLEPITSRRRSRSTTTQKSLPLQ